MYYSRVVGPTEFVIKIGIRERERELNNLDFHTPSQCSEMYIHVCRVSGINDLYRTRNDLDTSNVLLKNRA